MKSALFKLYNKRFVPFLQMLGIVAPCVPLPAGDPSPAVPPVSLLSPRKGMDLLGLIVYFAPGVISLEVETRHAACVH